MFHIFKKIIQYSHSIQSIEPSFSDEYIQRMILLKNQRVIYETNLLEKYHKVSLSKEKSRSADILFLSDAHGSFTENSFDDILHCNIDAIAILGDMQVSDLQIVRSAFPEKRIFGIYGNHDRYQKYGDFHIENIHEKIIEVNQISFAGIEGSFKYVGNCIGYAQEESSTIAARIPRADILISHAGPYCLETLNPSHNGLQGITDYLFQNQIKLHFHGHNHNSKEFTLSNGTVSKGIFKSELVHIQI